MNTLVRNPAWCIYSRRQPQKEAEIEFRGDGKKGDKKQSLLKES